MFKCDIQTIKQLLVNLPSLLYEYRNTKRRLLYLFIFFKYFIASLLYSTAK